MNRLILAFIGVLALSGCGAENLCDPTGNYSLTVTFGAGDCDATGVVDNYTFTVTETTESFQISGDPGDQVSGSIIQEGELCSLSFTVIEPPDEDGFSATSSWNLEERDGDVTGNGSATVTGPGVSCSQQFEATGRRR